jgi:hypothetical protein
MIGVYPGNLRYVLANTVDVYVFNFFNGRCMIVAKDNIGKQLAWNYHDHNLMFSATVFLSYTSGIMSWIFHLIHARQTCNLCEN